MFDHYYCKDSTKHCENEENIGALYFITFKHVLCVNISKSRALTPRASLINTWLVFLLKHSN